MQEGFVLVELNDVRAAHGLRPLELSSALIAAARQHTFEMFADGYFEHESVGGTPFGQRIRRCPAALQIVVFMPSIKRRIDEGDS